VIELRGGRIELLLRPDGELSIRLEKLSGPNNKLTISEARALTELVRAMYIPFP
jgi:hypothetical protein